MLDTGCPGLTGLETRFTIRELRDWNSSGRALHRSRGLCSALGIEVLPGIALKLALGVGRSANHENVEFCKRRSIATYWESKQVEKYSAVKNRDRYTLEMRKRQKVDF